MTTDEWKLGQRQELFDWLYSHKEHGDIEEHTFVNPYAPKDTDRPVIEKGEAAED